jgi:hypothetical protein
VKRAHDTSHPGQGVVRSETVAAGPADRDVDRDNDAPEVDVREEAIRRSAAVAAPLGGREARVEDGVSAGKRDLLGTDTALVPDEPTEARSDEACPRTRLPEPERDVRAEAPRRSVLQMLPPARALTNPDRTLNELERERLERATGREAAAEPIGVDPELRVVERDDAVVVVARLQPCRRCDPSLLDGGESYRLALARIRRRRSSRGSQGPRRRSERALCRRLRG